MKAIQISKYGGPEVLEINPNTTKPSVEENKILVENYASSINPFDFAFLAGRVKTTLPTTIGGDYSGKIVEIGSQVSDFKVGDEVFGSALILNGGSGAMAEFIVANVENSAKKPKNISFEEASSMSLVGASAVQAIEGSIKLRAGQKILIHGGAGGIGSISIQIAKAIGAYIATTVSSDDVEFAKSLGADQVIDYRTEDFTKKIKEYDAVFSTVGGEVVDKSFEALKKGGVLVSMKAIENENLAKERGVTAIAQNTNTNSEHLKRVAQLVESGKVKPQVDKIFSIDQAREAFEYQEKHSPRGKVVIKIK